MKYKLYLAICAVFYLSLASSAVIENLPKENADVANFKELQAPSDSTVEVVPSKEKSETLIPKVAEAEGKILQETISLNPINLAQVDSPAPVVTVEEPITKSLVTEPLSVQEPLGEKTVEGPTAAPELLKTDAAAVKVAVVSEVKKVEEAKNTPVKVEKIVVSPSTPVVVEEKKVATVQTPVAAVPSPPAVVEEEKKKEVVVASVLTPVAAPVVETASVHKATVPVALLEKNKTVDALKEDVNKTSPVGLKEPPVTLSLPFFSYLPFPWAGLAGSRYGTGSGAIYYGSTHLVQAKDGIKAGSKDNEELRLVTVDNSKNIYKTLGGDLVRLEYVEARKNLPPTWVKVAPLPYPPRSIGTEGAPALADSSNKKFTSIPVANVATSAAMDPVSTVDARLAKKIYPLRQSANLNWGAMTPVRARNAISSNVDLYEVDNGCTWQDGQPGGRCFFWDCIYDWDGYPIYCY